MLVGEYLHNLDQKGRIAIPYRLRHILGERAVITRGLDGCLNIYNMTEWQNVAAKLVALPMAQPNARRLKRFMLGGAVEVVFDKQGRVLVPTYLREYAQLENKVLIVGVYSHAEIWNQENWQKHQSDVDPAEELGELEI